MNTPNANELISALPEGDASSLEEKYKRRIERIAQVSPLYKKLLSNFPDYILWLIDRQDAIGPLRPSTLEFLWRNDFKPKSDDLTEKIHALQRFRRKLSMRICYREVNHIATTEGTLSDLSELANFCIKRVWEWTFTRWEQRLGTPWDEDLDKPARYCVLGLGKLGGSELNFCSDIDLIVFYEGNGYCRKNEKKSKFSNMEFFTRLTQEATNLLQERSADGFLYNVDLRLRPEGQTGPIVRNLTSMENYYYTAGQTWERLAMIKARIVAGDVELGEDFFESINTFRYPRFPPPSLLEEVAGVKIRIEKEVIGDADFDRNIKNGYGGIREIEFYIQALQLLNAGQNPFLQTTATLEALEKLNRYNLIDSQKSAFLGEAYRFLRDVENRLQMRGEEQTHVLPDGGPNRQILAESMNFDSEKEFDAHMAAIRDKVRENYKSLFANLQNEEEIQEWAILLSGNPPVPRIQSKLESWFGEFADGAPETIRNFVCGGPHRHVTREQVILFRGITEHFDELISQLAHPQRTLKRLAKYAEHYRARMRLLKACSNNSKFFRALCLLFDRSKFINEVLCKHPEIMEEVLSEQLIRHKTRKCIFREIGHLPQDETFPHWLWIYVKAEQIRHATRELLTHTSMQQTERNLTRLADASLQFALEKIDPEKELTLIGFGKFGGREMGFGSDLDLIILTGTKGDTSHLNKKVKQLKAIMEYHASHGPTFELDFRLRPHGAAGPLVTSFQALEDYYVKSAQTWERQMLTRARAITGDKQIIRNFEEFRNNLIYKTIIDKEEVREIWKMRIKIENEKAKPPNPERFYKAGSGGLVDVEFYCQIQQMIHGHKYPELRSTNTRQVLKQLEKLEIEEPKRMRKLRKNYNFLRTIELNLRREKNKSVDFISDDPGQQKSISKWLHFESFAMLMEKYQCILIENRTFLRQLVEKHTGLLEKSNV